MPRRLVTPSFWIRHRFLVSLALAWLGVAVALGGVIHVAHRIAATNSHVKHEAALGAKTYRAVCTLRVDLEHRVQDDTQRLVASKIFLRQHPRGIPGVPVAQIRASIASQQRALLNEGKTFKSLAGLGCP